MIAGPVRPFSERQMQVAERLVRKMKYKEIAAELGITEETVSKHVAKMGDLLTEPDHLLPKQRVIHWMKTRP